MQQLYKLGYREVILADDIFTSDHNWAVAVCEEFIKRGVRYFHTGMTPLIRLAAKQYWSIVGEKRL